MKIIDLFCGCGGFSEGFKQAGFEIIMGIDNWKDAIESFNLNFNNKGKLEDVQKIDKLPECDVVIGSPPCKEFSVNNIVRSFDDTLVKEFWRLAFSARPKYIVMENVPDVSKVIWMNHYILDAVMYGVPQRRKRLFAGNFPKPKPTTPFSYKTVKESIGDLPDEPTEHPHVCFDNVNLDIKFDQSKRTIKENRPAPTITTKERYGHIWKNRRLTILECLRLQTFPDDFKLVGSLSSQYTQVGNAVPCLLAKEIANTILEKEKRLNDELK